MLLLKLQDGRSLPKVDLELPQATVYSDKSKQKLQISLLDRLGRIKTAYDNHRDNFNLEHQRLTNHGESGINNLKNQITSYKNELSKEKAIYEKANRYLNVLKIKEPETWKNATVKDVLSSKGVESLRGLFKNDELSEASFRDFYDSFGKRYDANSVQTSEKDQLDLENSWYGPKDTLGRRRWMGDPRNVVKTATGAAYTAAAAGAAPLLLPALANPAVQAGLTTYGVYDAATNTLPEAYKDFKKEDYKSMAQNLGWAALDLAPIPFVGTNVVKDLTDAGKYAARKIAYHSIDPVGYGFIKKILKIPETLTMNILTPQKRVARVSDALFHPGNLKVGRQRLDAWALGLKQPQKYNTFQQIGDNTFSITNPDDYYRFPFLAGDIQAFSLNDKAMNQILKETDFPLSKYSNLHPLEQLTFKYLKNNHIPIDHNYSREYFLNKKVPMWESKNIVEKAKNKNFDFSVYDADTVNGVMGSFRWDVKQRPDKTWHFQANDTWDINPWEKRGSILVNESDNLKKMLRKYYRKKLENIEILSLLGGKPFKIQNNFLLDENFNILKKFNLGGILLKF
jgi:hypothetical protein